MRYIYLIITLLLFGNFGFGQTVLFDESGGGSEPSGWTFANNVTSQPIDRNSYWLVEDGSTNDFIITDTYDLSNFSNAEFSLRLATFGSGGANPARIEISDDGGSTYSQVEISNTPSSSTYIDGGTFTINSLTNSVKIRISSNGTSGRDVRLRDLKLEGTVILSGPANPDAFSANPISATQIDLDYDDNAAANDVVIVFNFDSNFDTPSGSPTVGNNFGDDEILFVGNGNGVLNHTGLIENTTYFYRAYSYDGTDYSSGIDTEATTPFGPIDCAGPGITDGFCYANNETFTLDYSSANGDPLLLEFTSGSLEPFGTGTYDDLIIYDGIDNSATVLYNSDVDGGGDITGLTFIAISGNIFLEFDSDSSNSCATGDETAISFDITCTDEPNSATADIVEANYDEPDNIEYINFLATSGLDETNAIKIGEFTIRDAGPAPADSDEVSTTLTELTFDVIGADNIAALAIIDPLILPDSNLGETITVTSTTTFTGLSIEVPDDGIRTLSIYATFDASSVTDNEQIQLTITSATADENGSTFATTNAGGAQTSFDGDDNRIEVTATNLFFDANTTNVEVNALMAPSPTVVAIDDELNTDLDFEDTVTLTSNTSGIFAVTASVAETAVLGVATFDNLSFDTIGTAFTLSTIESNLSNDTSSGFDVTPMAATGAGATDLFFSEYIEGSSNNKYLEIYNGTGADVSLENYSVELYASGTGPNNTEDFTSGFPTTLADGNVIVLQNSSATIYTGTTFNSSVCNYNGDDTIVLKNNGVVIDIIGNLGCDPGSSFSSASNNLQNETLVRSASVCEGVAIDPSNPPCEFSTLETEWTSFGQDDVSNLGSHTANCGTSPTCNTFPGNGRTGFGGSGLLGSSTLEVCALPATTEIDFTLTKGADTSFDSNIVVIYIDSDPNSGVTTTANLFDNGDPGRVAISGFNGTDRATLLFPPGFSANYAITIDGSNANLFEINEGSGSSHTFIDGANLTVNGDILTFDINFTEIATAPGGQSFNILATLISDTAFRSNEAIGINDAINNPGQGPSGMVTYFEVNSGLQGGIALSTNDGLWSDASTWANGNPPLGEDELVILNDVTLDMDFNATKIDINGAGIFTVNAGQTLSISDENNNANLDGISGTGSLTVNGKLIISNGGFTNIVPTYGIGSTLEYRNIANTFSRFNEWTDGLATGLGVPDNVIIENATLDLTNGAQSLTEDFTVGNDLTLFTNGNLTIDANESISVKNNLINDNGRLDMNSMSTAFSSLIVEGASVGEVIYRRHTNIFVPGSTTGENDLLAAPVTSLSQTFGMFRAHPENANLPSGTIAGVPSFLFGPFDIDNNVFVNYNASDDASVIVPGVGYRTGSNPAGPLTFTGDVETADVSVAIDLGAMSPWNLIGNPYSSYISSSEFLTVNTSNLPANNVAIYGYDGDSQDGYTVINLNSDAYNMAPGQGFFVAADGISLVEFTTDMRNVDGGNDFIPARVENNQHVVLQLENDASTFTTDFYFNSNSSLGLDPGYDAAIFDSVLPDLYIYSHLVEENEGIAMAIQSLGTADLNTVTIPLGVHAAQGQQITFSIIESNLSESIEIYLDDTVANTSTLISSTNYTLTLDNIQAGTGRFFLKYSDEALSTNDDVLNQLNIYASKASETIVISGQLFAATTCSIYDIQGRLVLTTDLDHTILENSVNVEYVDTGIYIVKIENSGQEKVQKLVID
ncbi:MAG: lamin tail domain-containing protein [Psychroserpens sp.]|uniref:lamin tail domain-containing protein n=1 Tax=Psychroserpens sp. TaxID=2020870 RepID=UPI003CA11157